jgi:hypothetical protein
MAKKTKSGPSVGLIVTLVFFVLATLVAGTMAYLAQEDIKAAENKAAEATKKLKDMDDQRRDERIRKVIDRIALGIEDPEKDRTLLVQELDALRVTIGEEYDRIKNSMDKNGASITRKELDNLRAEMDKKKDDSMQLAQFTFSWPTLTGTSAEAQKAELEGGPGVGPSSGSMRRGRRKRKRRERMRKPRRPTPRIGPK